MDDEELLDLGEGFLFDGGAVVSGLDEQVRQSVVSARDGRIFLD